IELLWVRVDAGRTEREALGDELGAQIDDVDERVAAMKNTARGAMWVLGIVLGVVQTFLVGSIVWVFTHVNEGDILNRLQQQRIEELEKTLSRTDGSRQ
ncbi:hypothetical protein PQR14_36805, partial [Paraburkholderia bryophila]|uniref:hypothetical protein n=1 Tax=Paraburkholderia bryophila TaxID=420952 RepID=UPI0038BC43FE